jgi:hypothetical protein
VITFHNDDAGWFDWLDSNPGGYFMQKSSSAAGMIIHRPNCPHIDREDIWSDGRMIRWTKRIKFCSVDTLKLDSLAQQETGLRARRCRDCF